MHLISTLVFVYTVSEHFNISFQMYGHIIATWEKVACICSLYATFSNEIYIEN